MNQHIAATHQITHEHWLKHYYFIRAAFSIAWVIAALTIARHSPAASALLLVGYPVWDALANFVDGQRGGGLAKNLTQLLNVIASLAVAVALVRALPEMHEVLAVFGAWAILSGLLQLGTAARRWKSSRGQWAMMLSGAQSAAAGAVFISQAHLPAMPTINTVAGYAGFGALYFLVAALLLSYNHRRLRATASRTENRK